MTGVDRVVIKGFLAATGARSRIVSSRPRPRRNQLGLILTSHELSNGLVLLSPVRAGRLALAGDSADARRAWGRRQGSGGGSRTARTCSRHSPCTAPAGCGTRDVKPTISSPPASAPGRLRPDHTAAIEPDADDARNEYFRDPEMGAGWPAARRCTGRRREVRHLRGCCAHAVLENHFPARRASQISSVPQVGAVGGPTERPTRQALRTHRRDARRPESILASDPFARPADLPSVRGPGLRAEAAAIAVDSASPTRSSPPPPGSRMEATRTVTEPRSASSSAGLPRAHRSCQASANPGRSTGPGFEPSGPSGPPRRQRQAGH